MKLTISPDLAGFHSQAEERRVISVYARVQAEDLTPVGLYRRLCGRKPGTFLFESAEAGAWSRWSFVGVTAIATLSSVGDSVTWTGRQISGLPLSGPPLQVLREAVATLQTPRDETLPPFTSGFVGYLGYDMVRHIEHLPDTNPDDLHAPDMVMMLAGDLAVFDHLRAEVWLIANAVNHDGSPERADAAYADARSRVEAMAAQLARPLPALLSQHTAPAEPAIRRQSTDAHFMDVVRRAKQQIVAGEIFQVVPSQRFDVATDADPLELYCELRVTNPSPYLFLLRLPDLAIVGASPEALVTVVNGQATTHPIAGTRPRGTDPADDLALERELLADEKEGAEHLMLVDLGRNDLGRVCVPGTVVVTEFRHVRRYSHVMHLEAQVTGRVQPEISAVDVVMACFPAGTLSGAPKVRAMQLIDELEEVRRGPYGGVVGYFDFAGNADVAITIRSAVIKDGIARVQAGAGIVADSDPAAENLECQTKARAMVTAISRAAARARVEFDVEGQR